ncbi:MAG: hypothetical protein QNL34_02055 [OM182 bacterium]
MSRNDQAHDIEMVLAYNHINLYLDQQDIDPFVRMKFLNVELSYIAQINIEIAETATREKVWGGRDKSHPSGYTGRIYARRTSEPRVLQSLCPRARELSCEGVSTTA